MATGREASSECCIESMSEGRGRRMTVHIKMGIDCGETCTLKGTWETLKKFTRQLTISVYHRLRDLPDGAALMQQACLGYHSYMANKLPSPTETVPFAESLGTSPENRGAAR